MKTIIKLIVLFVFAATPALLAQTTTQSIIILPIQSTVPPGAKMLGSIKAGNNATASECDYEALINRAKEKAKGMGGNLVKITKLIAPVFISKCYKIEADVYAVATLPEYKIETGTANILTPTNKECATIYIYRLKDTVAFAGSYNVHLNNDSVICSVKSKSRDSVKIYNEGPITLWSKIEKRTELKLTPEKGHAYYVRCGMVKGEIRMIPVLTLMDNEEGAKEFEDRGKKKKDMDVKFLSQIH